MKPIKIILLPIILFVVLGHAQKLKTNDSLKSVIKSIHSDSLRLKTNAYGDLIWSYASSRIHIDSAKMYTDSLYKFSKNTGYERGIARTHFYYGVINRFEGNNKKGLEHLEKFVKYFQEKGEKEFAANGLYQMASILSNMGDYSESLSTHYELIEIYKTLKDKNAEANELQSIGSILRKVGKTDEAINSYSEAVKIFKETANDPIGLSMTYESLGNTYAEVGDYKKSESYYFESLSIEKKENNQDGIASVSENLGNLFYLKGDFKNALLYHLEALKYRENMPSKRNLAISLNTVGKDYLALNQDKKAEGYLLKSLAISEKTNLKTTSIENYEALIKLNEKKNNFKEGFKYQNLLMKVKDSVLNKDRINQILNLSTKYETEKKEREITEQQFTIEKKEQQKQQLLLGLFALLIMLMGSFFFFKKRLKYQNTIAEQSKAIQEQRITELQQKNKLLALNSMLEGQEAERLRIAKDLHDSLGGLLSTVKNHFSTIQNEIKALEKLNITEKTGILIDEACIEVRRISHNMMPHALSISGLKGALEDLTEQLKTEGFDTTLEISGTLATLNETKKIMIYRLIQEIISNIRKHAEAKNILMQLLVSESELRLIIEDDGKGFDYNKALAKGGLGIKNINSRVDYLNGNIEWDSQTNKGTSISINIPL